MKLFTREEKLAMVADAVERIRAGEVLSVADASYSALGLCIGDFCEIGWATKNTWRSGMNWSWNGPAPIRVNGEYLLPGMDTAEVDMDWS